jgi:hypothetical protein
MNERKVYGYWKDEGNALAEARKAMREQGWENLPSADILGEHGYSSLGFAIKKYHGGIQEFRLSLGQENARCPTGYMQDVENVLVDAGDIIDRENWETLPSERKLRGRGYFALVNAIGRYYGGIPAFRKLLEERGVIQSQGQQLEKLVGGYGDGE